MIRFADRAPALGKRGHATTAARRVKKFGKDADLAAANETNRDVDRQRKIKNLPPEKLQMLQEKRKELEHAYKQDCETFATVVKMLIRYGKM